MNCLSDKQNHRFIICIGLFCIFLLIFFLSFGWMQSCQVRDGFFVWEKKVASSLLEQGVEEEVVAEAFESQNSSGQGELFLQKIGHVKGNVPVLFDLPGEVWDFSLIWSVAGFLSFSSILFFLVFFYLIRRDRLYQRAFRTLEQFRGGDFTKRLPRGEPGSLYQLFDMINELATALKAKSDLEHRAKLFLKDTISDISHQLKTPLAALSMYMEIISGEPENVKTVKTFISKSMQSLERMERLIQTLLKIARLDTGNVVFEKKNCLIQELAELSAADLKSRAKSEGKELILEGNPESMLFCDPLWTQEAIGNLVKNALDHTQKGGRIRLRWEQSPVMVRILVEDDGCGILPEDRYHIFKRFYRSRYSRDTKGTGLGLPLVKSIVEGQGGIVTVESIPQKGSIFILSFLTDP